MNRLHAPRAATGALTALALVVSLLALAVATAPPAEAAPMTKQRAGKVYLAHACRYNTGVFEYNHLVVGGDDRFTLRDIRPAHRFRHAKRLDRRQVRQTRRMLRAFSPSRKWPRPVRTHMRAYNTSMRKLAAARVRQARPGTTRRQYMRIYTRSYKFDRRSGRQGRIIRRKLNLPPPGFGC